MKRSRRRVRARRTRTAARAFGRAPHPAGPRSPRGGSKERILDVATRLFAERGFSATSIDTLSRRSGVARTVLYWHFGSKEGLLAATLDEAARRWIEEIRDSAYQSGEPPERLDRALAGMRAIVEERPQLLRLLLAVTVERAEEDSTVRGVLRSVFQRAEEALVRGIEDALGTTLPELDLVARAVLNQLAGVALLRLVDPERTDLDRFFAELRRSIILSLRSRFGEEGAGGTPVRELAARRRAAAALRADLRAPHAARAARSTR